MRLESYRATPEEVLQDQHVSLARGLSRSEATRRLREHGPNRLRESRGQSVWRILLDQVASVVIGLLIAAAAAAAAFGAWVEATAILAALLMDTLVGFVMELRASRAMQALQRLGRVTARVRRDFHGKGLRVAVKGAPEAVLDVCTRVLTPTGETPLDDKGRADWQARSDGLAGDGLRVLALAEKGAEESSENPYDRLTLIGLADLRDPPRPGVAEAVAACQAAGIRVVLGTGDHAATARAIAVEVGLAEADTAVIPAGEVKAPDALDADFRDRLLHAKVYARISPEQKLHLIDLYQRAGMVVAMTGDGVNDAPALKKADIGIAMGRRGTQVAREAADRDCCGSRVGSRSGWPAGASGRWLKSRGHLRWMRCADLLTALSQWARMAGSALRATFIVMLLST